MELSTSMRFCIARAGAEMSALEQSDVVCEHLFLAILKLSELSAEAISPTSRHKEETEGDIQSVNEMLGRFGIVSGPARQKMRHLLKRELVPMGGAQEFVQLMTAAAEQAKERRVLASDVLLLMLDNPSEAMRMVIPGGGEDSAPAQEQEEEEQETGLPFLSELTQRIRTMRYTLLEKVHGQDHVVHTFAEGMFSAEVLAHADEGRKRPRAIFVFAGPPGVGKTFLAEQAAQALAMPFKRFDMSSYADHQAHMGLIGFAPSYKDAKEGALTGFVKKNPHCILLFDEIEKAHLNAIQLFLQVLDAGNLHDEYTDKDVAFKDCIIVFTTNAGRQLYEGDQQNGAAGLSRITILNALQSDTHPQTGKAYFPAAIASRLATGFPIMFAHLAAHHLERISAGELTRFCGLFEKQYGIRASFDPRLPAIVLFAQGGQADARTVRAQSELFFKTEIFKLCRLWGEDMIKALEQLEELHIELEVDALPAAVLPLFKNPTKPEVLVFGDELLAARLQMALPSVLVHGATQPEEAFALIGKRDIQLTLLSLHSDEEEDVDPMATRASLDEPVVGMGTMAAFDHIPMAAHSLRESRAFFTALTERMPDMPIYLLETQSVALDGELLGAFMRAGARGKLIASGQEVDVLGEEIEQICAQLYLQTAAASLAAQRKVLSFETAPMLSVDKKTAHIRLRELRLRRAPDAADKGSVLEEVEKPKVRFSDVIGAQGAKDELTFFIQYLKDPKKFAAQGLKPPKGVLLYGPPGTGKTLLAKAMAGESDVAFIPAVGSAFVTKWQGSGPEAVRELFARAKRYAPAIIFIDEIDAIGRARQGGGTAHGEEMALNALLTQMDGFSVDPKRPVFVLAATNFEVEEGKGGMGVLDAALVRRFDRKILVDLPTKEDRRRYLEYMLAKRAHHEVSAAMMTRLAERSAGLSLANLEGVIEMAARNAAKENKAITDDMLEEALELSRHGEQKDWGHDYLERVARHESGHAYLCYVGGHTPSYLTIVARGSHGGYMEHADTESSPLQTRDELIARLRTSLGGRAAEMVYYGEEAGISTGASGDLESATRIARAMLCSYGMDADFGMATLSTKEATQGPLALEVTKKINEIIGEQMQETIKLIASGKGQIDRLVAALLEKNKLTREEMEAILGA